MRRREGIETDLVDHYCLFLSETAPEHKDDVGTGPVDGSDDFFVKACDVKIELAGTMQI